MKTGTLKSKATGREIPGVNLIRADSMFYVVRLDPLGLDSTNNMPKDLWEFIPDTKPLPRHAVITAPGYLPLLIISGKVYQAVHAVGGVDINEKDEEFALARLRYAGAVILVDGETLDKEDYL